MNIFLWVLQSVLAWFCLAGGAYQIIKVDELKKMAASMRELPRALWTFLGACSVLGGLGMILPGATHVMPVLTPIAAAALAVENAVLTAVYTHFGDSAPRKYSVAIAVLAAFVAYGRFVLAPL
ncbi:MAG TPA: DoxX family protein [bacterium]|jgi:hypothetical protein|nr:DoxX family protein [bacterium]